MSKFLLDANISPETAEFLRTTLGLDAVALPREQLTLKDPEIVALAKVQGRVIVTFDLDFGELYHSLVVLQEERARIVRAEGT